VTYSEAVAYLESLIDYERTPAGAAAARLWNLDRMRRMLHAAGDPHLWRRCLHIAGTKGKGSTAAMATAMLGAAGYRVGLYSKPHMVTFRERIRVDRTLIAEEEVAALAEEIRPVLEEARAGDLGPPSFFEAYTLMAFLHFARQEVDFAVMETGLGGRLDATNVITPLACAITRLGFDHMLELGDTIAEIAREKAGIIKPGVPVISAPQVAEAREVLADVALERGARLLVVGEEGAPQVSITRADATGIRFSLRGLNAHYADLTCPLVGRHQAENAAVAVGLVELLSEHGIGVPAEAVRTGLSSVHWPGRFQIVRRRPTVVLDGAHNEPAAEVLAETLTSLYWSRRIILVLGIHKDKDAEAVAARLCPLADRVIATADANPRAMAASDLHDLVFSRSKHVAALTPVSLAVREAIDGAHGDDVIIITGSLYVVGEAMRALGVDPAA
jgi:dihydrofolate synthase/folylpolyglutamate synthase